MKNVFRDPTIGVQDKEDDHDQVFHSVLEATNLPFLSLTCLRLLCGYNSKQRRRLERRLIMKSGSSTSAPPPLPPLMALHLAFGVCGRGFGGVGGGSQSGSSVRSDKPRSLQRHGT